MGKPFLINQNKKAYFNYEILNKIEAGIVLNGPEIKSVRQRNVSIDDAFVLIRNHEVFVYNLFIKKYPFANNIKGLEETRVRKLLLHTNEINRLEKTIKQQALNVIPLKIYLKNNHAKLELGLGRGKKNYDKRETIKKRELERKSRRYRP